MNYAQALRAFNPTLTGYGYTDESSASNFLASLVNWPEGEPLPTAAELESVVGAAEKNAVLAQARQLREISLDRLGGLAGRASRAGDPATAAACDAAAISLLAITATPAVIAAIDGPSTQAALTVEWRNIAATLTASAPSAVSVFVGLGL